MLEHLQDELDIQINCVAAGEHVPEAERNNRLIKERVRATFHSLPFKALPNVLMKPLVIESAKKLNYFPSRAGVSRYFSPRQIVQQVSLDYRRHCFHEFGSYVQAHEEPEKSNRQDPRTSDCIYIRPTPYPLLTEIHTCAWQTTDT